MRIIAGSLGGRQFASPKSNRTHPMSDKVRGALFNILGDLDGLAVLDAFAGSGALSFEAISRGAASATAIENDKKAHQSIRENARTIGITDRVKTILASVSGWSANNPEAQFELVVADPPFDNLQPLVLQKLINHIKPSGLYVLNWPGHLDVPDFGDLVQIDNKRYGDTQLVFYRKTS